MDLVEESIPTLSKTDELSPQNLWSAISAHRRGRNVEEWLSNLHLGGKKPSTTSQALWDRARWFYAEVLFDQGKIKESEQLFDSLVDAWRTRPSFHQQRAWVQLRAENFEMALGSIMSAMSPLLRPTPFPKKHLIKALVQKEHCQWQEVLNTIQTADSSMEASDTHDAHHPWIQICERRNLGPLCQDLRRWVQQGYENEASFVAETLQLIKTELREKEAVRKKDSSLDHSKATWIFDGEHWKDDLGRYFVEVENQC